MKDSNLNSFISDRISSLRGTISARELSISIGQNENYINQIELGKSTPSIEALEVICEYFKISLSEFFDEGNINPSLLKDLIHVAKRLDRESLESFIVLANKIK